MDFKMITDDALWQRLEELENETLVVRMELAARAITIPGRDLASGAVIDVPTLMQKSRLEYLRKKFSPPDKVAGRRPSTAGAVDPLTAPDIL
jgi:hypothetical protein